MKNQLVTSYTLKHDVNRGFLITYRTILSNTAKINDNWTNNEINNNNNHKASLFKTLYTQYIYKYLR
jgi:hypothetical protein